MSETFSAADLEPSAEDRARGRRSVVDRVFASLAVVAAGTVLGGILALGACAAPMVFSMTPPPFSGNAMGAAFARFDRIAVGASAVVLGAEMVRTWLARRRRPEIVARIRRLAAILLAGAASAIAIYATPTINDLHKAGVRRGEGTEGARLDAVHRQAETLGKAELGFAALVMVLHVFTLRSREEDEEDEDLPSVGLPGPDPDEQES
jgi:hypothetical protein